jgi:hypothetical protein
MSDEHEQACKLNEAEEVLDVEFPSGDQSAVVLHPGKEPLDFPSAAIAAQRTAILCLPFAVGSIRRDHLDAVFAHLLVERIRVVGLVADKSFRQLVEEASGQNSFHKPALGRRSAFDRYGERKTVTRGDSDDLGALAALGGADREAPFLALANVASTNASSRFNLPRSCRWRASKRNTSTNLPSRTHCWKRRWQV